MKKLFLVLMVVFTLFGSMIAGAGSFLTMNKFMEGVDYEKIAESKQLIEKMKGEGVDLTNNPEYADMITKINDVPSESMVMLTKGLSILAILVAFAMCATAFKKQEIATKLAIVLPILSVVLFIVTPDLKGGMTAPMPLKMIMGASIAMFVLASGSGFLAAKK